MVLNISVSYASQTRQFYKTLQVGSGTTLYQAIQLSGVLQEASLQNFENWCQQNYNHDTNHKTWYVGIYSQKKRLDTVLVDGDRVEIYRPLTIDPMARRKVKSKNNKST
ncbi:MAG: RnfH family protein [Moraxella sp.]